MITSRSIRKVGQAVVILALFAMIAGVRTASATSNTNNSQSEAALSKHVRHQLATLPFYGVFDNLEYSVNGTEVTLTGQVVQPVTKSDAGNVVKKIEGVTRVVNNITVLPVSAFDNQIRRAEFRAIFSDQSLGKYSMGAVPAIHIVVDNGHVTLDGVVMNKMDHDVATIRANSVPDVFSVTNNLRID